jgi:hypothetical protein
MSIREYVAESDAATTRNAEGERHTARCVAARRVRANLAAHPLASRTRILREGEIYPAHANACSRDDTTTC